MSYNPSGPVHMYDDGAYISVTNDNTSTVINFVKAALFIQKDSSERFFLKNDSFISYYQYTDVSTPVSSSIDDLLMQLKAWNVGGATVQVSNSNLPVTIQNTSIATTLPNTMMDSFENLKVSSESKVLLSISSTYDTSPTQITQYINNGADSSNDFHKGVVGMTVSTDNNSYIIRQSKQYIPYVHGATNTAIVCGRLINDPEPFQVLARIGVFDDSNYYNGTQPIGNGMFFQAYNNNLAAIYQTNVSGIQDVVEVSQGGWNLDTMNGNGPSGFTYNSSKVYDYVFQYNQSIPGSARVGIMGYNNTTNEYGVIWCHRFDNAPKFGNPSFPVRWDLWTYGNDGGFFMWQGPAVVYTDKNIKNTQRLFQVTLGGNMITITQPSTKPLFTVRLREGAERAMLKPRSLQIVNIAPGGYGYWELVVNATLNNPDWQPISGGTSFAKWDIASDAVMGGNVIASGFIYDASIEKINLTDYDISLTSDIYGNTDTLTLQVTNVNGVLNVSASLEWFEQD